MQVYQMLSFSSAERDNLCQITSHYIHIFRKHFAPDGIRISILAVKSFINWPIEKMSLTRLKRKDLTQFGNIIVLLLILPEDFLNIQYCSVFLLIRKILSFSSGDRIIWQISKHFILMKPFFVISIYNYKIFRGGVNNKTTVSENWITLVCWTSAYLAHFGVTSKWFYKAPHF